MNQIVLKDKVGEFGARLKVLARGLERARQLRMKEVASRDALVNFLLNNVELIQSLADCFADLDDENTSLERDLIAAEKELRELRATTPVPNATTSANNTSEGVSRSVAPEELLCGAERSGAKSGGDTQPGALVETKSMVKAKSHAAKKSVKEV